MLMICDWAAGSQLVGQIFTWFQALLVSLQAYHPGWLMSVLTVVAEMPALLRLLLCCSFVLQAIHRCRAWSVADRFEQSDRPGVIQWYIVLHIPTAVCCIAGVLCWGNGGLNSTWKGEIL